MPNGVEVRTKKRKVHYVLIESIVAATGLIGFLVYQEQPIGIILGWVGLVSLFVLVGMIGMKP
jgi:hypothetical protein